MSGFIIVVLDIFFVLITRPRSFLRKIILAKFRSVLFGLF